MRDRLLYVVNIPRFFVSHRLPLALAAQGAGYDVHVATSATDPANSAVIREHGLSLHPIPLEQHGRRPLQEFRTLAALIVLMKRLQPDLIHTVTIKPVIYGGFAARLTRRRAVVAAMSGLGRTFRDPNGGIRRPTAPVRTAFRLALPPSTSHLLLQNADDLELLRAEGIAHRSRSSVIAGSGVDLTAFRPAVDQRPSGRQVTFLYAGRLMRQKGIGDFVEAARRLAGQARFLVAGYSEEGSPDAVPVAEVERWAADGIIDWLGARTDMPELLAAVDIVVLPTTYGEGVPRTLIEAAACGRTIIASDTPGCRDVCIDGTNGSLIPPGDVDALVAEMSAMIRDPTSAAAMGAAGRALAEERFGSDRIIGQTLALYERMLTSSP